MNFITTNITVEMVKKYDMKQDYALLENSDENFIIIGERDELARYQPFNSNLENLKSANITINKEGNCYLRYGGRSHPDMGFRGHSYYLLYWQGQRIYFVETIEDYKECDKENKILYTKHNIIQMSSLEPIQLTDELFKSLEQAITTTYLGGDDWSYNLQFDFDKVR